jgi:hypothetical protein
MRLTCSYEDRATLVESVATSFVSVRLRRNSLTRAVTDVISPFPSQARYGRVVLILYVLLSQHIGD